MGERRDYIPPEYEQAGAEVETQATIATRVTEHSREMDEELAKQLPNWEGGLKMERDAFQVREWVIGDTTIRAIGVAHVPETFLFARQEIETAISGADIVVNEFAPEALGFYSRAEGVRLSSRRSPIDGRFTLEQLRQLYLEKEQMWNMGLFHHEVELLAAKYGVDMAVIDLKDLDVEDALRDPLDMGEVASSELPESINVQARNAREGQAEKVRAEKGALYTLGTILLGIGVPPIVQNLRSQDKMPRRDFLKILGLAAGGAALGSLGFSLREPKQPPAVPGRPHSPHEAEAKEKEIDKLEVLRNPILADSLRRLAEDGYKRVVFIYGARHLPHVEHYLMQPRECLRELQDNRDFIHRYNPDHFKVFRYKEGHNDSERFVASREYSWKRVERAVEAR